MNEGKSLYCPRCGKRVCGISPRCTIDFIAKCKNCGQGVKYIVCTDSVMLVKIPERQTSSGVRFY